MPADMFSTLAPVKSKPSGFNINTYELKPAEKLRINRLLAQAIDGGLPRTCAHCLKLFVSHREVARAIRVEYRAWEGAVSWRISHMLFCEPCTHLTNHGYDAKRMLGVET